MAAALEMNAERGLLPMPLEELLEAGLLIHLRSLGTAVEEAG